MAEIRSPIDNHVAFTYAELGFEEALKRVDEAEAAERAFRHTSIADRAALVERMLVAYQSHLDANAEAITRMMGKPLAHARAEFERPMSARARYLASIAEEALQPEKFGDQPGFARSIERVPVG